MSSKTKVRKEPQWPTREVLVGCCPLALAGCGEGGGYLVGSVIGGALANDSTGGSHRSNQRRGSDVLGDPTEVQVTDARLRAMPGGCEVDVTFTNVSGKPLSAAFDADIVDGAGRGVASRSTAVLRAHAGETPARAASGARRMVRLA